MKKSAMAQTTLYGFAIDLLASGDATDLSVEPVASMLYRHTGKK
jgi:hypothetical protein